MNTDTSMATVIRPMKPGMTENVRMGTRTAMAIAEARPGRRGWSSWRAAAVTATGVEGKGFVEDTCDNSSEDETVDDGTSEYEGEVWEAKFSE